MRSKFPKCVCLLYSIEMSIYFRQDFNQPSSSFCVIPLNTLEENRFSKISLMVHYLVGDLTLFSEGSGPLVTLFALGCCN